MAVRSVYKQNEPDTQYGEFAPHREQKVGLNSASAYDTNSGYSPMTRWLSYAFEHTDFVSNVESGGCYVCRFPIPRYTMLMRAAIRVDTVFDNTSAVDIGTGGVPDSAPGDGWGEDLSLHSTGLKYDPNADYNPGGDVGMQIYVSGDTIDIYTSSGTAPTVGEGILLLEIISYHEPYVSEW